MAHALMQPVFAMELAKTPKSIPHCLHARRRAIPGAKSGEHLHRLAI